MEAQLGLCQTAEIRATTGWIRWIHAALRGFTLNKVQLEDRCVFWLQSECLSAALSQKHQHHGQKLGRFQVFLFPCWMGFQADWVCLCSSLGTKLVPFDSRATKLLLPRGP